MQKNEQGQDSQKGAIHWFVSLQHNPKMFIHKNLESMNNRYANYKHYLETKGAT